MRTKEKKKQVETVLQELIGIWEDAAVLCRQLMFPKSCAFIHRQLMLAMFYASIERKMENKETNFALQ